LGFIFDKIYSGTTVYDLFTGLRFYGRGGFLLGFGVSMIF
jgi:hypothetical protein